MRLLVALTLCLAAACSASPSPAIGDAAAQCEPGVRYDCDCGPTRPKGSALCSASATRGGCDCQSTTTEPDGGEGTPDASCEAPSTFYRDVDGDGHGSGVPTPACERPAGYALVDDDCDDTDARVHPGQTDFFDTPRSGGSFDFDCNGADEPEKSQVGGCDIVGGVCNGTGNTNFWYREAPTQCGKPGTWGLLCAGGCALTPVMRNLKCR